MKAREKLIIAGCLNNKYKMLSKLDKNKRKLLFLIVLLGFALRFYGSLSTPLNYDERLESPSSKEISFNFTNSSLPLVEEGTYASVGDIYFRALGFYFFGENILGSRIFYVFSGALAIFLVYFLVKMGLGVKVALLAAFLLAISQYHIGLTKSAHSGFLDPVVILSLILFYKTIRNASKHMFLLNGLIIGVGCWMMENVIFLVPIYIIFLFFSPDYRRCLKEKYLWISFGLAFLFFLPNIYLIFDLNTPRSVLLADSILKLRPGVNAISVYLGELILYALRPFSNFFEIAMTRDDDIPTETFIFGIVILVGVIYSVKDKRPFIRLMLVSFFFNFILFSFIRPRAAGIDTFWDLGDLSWSSLGFIPGVILAANMLSDILKRRNHGRIFFGFLISFMLIRAIDCVTYPLNAQVPIRYFHIKRFAFPEVDHLIQEGDFAAAEDILRRIYKVTAKKPGIQKKAISRLLSISSYKKE